MPPQVNLLPAQADVAYDDPSHRYWIWSARRGQWLPLSSTSQVLTSSGAKGFDPTHWKRSLVDRHGLRPDEAEVYMALHRNNRADVGTELHGLIRAELLGGSFHPRLAESLMLLSVWRREFLPRVEAVILCEAPLASRSLFFSGTPDLVARVEGAWMTVDWKSKVSAEKAKPESGWRLQLTGYDLIVEEEHRIRLDGAMNLMIWPGGCKDVWYNRADLNQSRPLFIGHLAWAHALKAAEGCPNHQGALEHLLTLHPGALEAVAPPQGHGPWTVAQALAPKGIDIAPAEGA
jgi:CRISPR/Cas system-associated exonuclease Cas4 (RecB family)